MASIADVIKFTPTLGGLTDWTLATAATGYRTPSGNLTNGSTYSYRAESADKSEWEVGTGAWTSATSTLARTTVLYSSTGAKVNFAVAPSVAVVALTADVAPPDADYLVKTAHGGLSAERVVTDGAAAGKVNWDWTVAGTVKGVLYASAADKFLYATAADTWAEGAITTAGRALLDDTDAAAQRTTLSVRETLTATRSYYVRTDGSDSNTGLADTSGSAFLTLQKAIDTVAALDISTYDVTIYVADGTYTAGVSVVGPWVGAATVTLQGNTTTPANVIISTTSANCIEVSQGGRLSVKGFKFTTTTSGTAVQASTNGDITLNGSFEVGACAAYQILAQTGGAVSINTNYTISGGALYHWIATLGGIIRCVSRTVTLTGTPAYTMNFAYASHLSVIGCKSDTFSGSATGTRYLVEANAVVSTNGGGATYLPGNASGSTSTGGQYI